MRLIFALESQSGTTLHVGRSPDLTRRAARADRGETHLVAVWLPMPALGAADLIAAVDARLAAMRLGPGVYRAPGTVVVAAVDAVRRRHVRLSRLRAARSRVRRLVQTIRHGLAMRAFRTSPG